MFTVFGFAIALILFFSIFAKDEPKNKDLNLNTTTKNKPLDLSIVVTGAVLGLIAVLQVLVICFLIVFMKWYLDLSFLTQAIIFMFTGFLGWGIAIDIFFRILAITMPFLIIFSSLLKDEKYFDLAVTILVSILTYIVISNVFSEILYSLDFWELYKLFKKSVLYKF